MQRRILVAIVCGSIGLIILPLSLLAVLALSSSSSHTDFIIEVQTQAGYPAIGATVAIVDAKSHGGVGIPYRAVYHTTTNYWGQASIDFSQERQHMASNRTTIQPSYNYMALISTGTGEFQVWNFSWNYRTNSFSGEAQGTIPTLRVTTRKH